LDLASFCVFSVVVAKLQRLVRLLAPLSIKMRAGIKTGAACSYLKAKRKLEKKKN